MTTNLENEVTVLAYHFWDDQGYDAAFGRLALAVRETWRHCGQLRTVLVVNKTRPCIEAFAAENREVEVQVEPSLVPGDINSMSADCNSRLWTRFSTPYVLVIQADGYPLRGGLEEFVGKYDFIGAPYVAAFRCVRGGYARLPPGTGTASTRRRGGFPMRPKISITPSFCRSMNGNIVGRSGWRRIANR